MTFLACASIIGSVQCLYAPKQEEPITFVTHAKETKMKQIHEDTSHISPDFIRLASMKIEKQADEEEINSKGAAIAAKADDITETPDKKVSVDDKGSKEKVKNKKLESELVAEVAKGAEKATVTKDGELREPAALETEKAEKTAPEEVADNKVITVTATAYTADCEGGTGVTYTGVDLKANPDAKVIAVDPAVIPLGTEVYVEGYGHAVAADIGGAIKGDKIDVFIPNEDAAEAWGMKTVDVTIIQ
ncbi:hypothetical protein CYL18_04090 [Pradoshia eiseniae]|uniref:3D domain-containing protein n=2 Tax=Pradoshia eiseniae TaxID=2064768 RepID=A0A2S7N5C1_9BACI|nr:hypothetical protein CYL18_04090 [Pradoshia eiseniae]